MEIFFDGLSGWLRTTVNAPLIYLATVLFIRVSGEYGSNHFSRNPIINLKGSGKVAP